MGLWRIAYLVMRALLPERSLVGSGFGFQGVFSFGAGAVFAWHCGNHDGERDYGIPLGTHNTTCGGGSRCISL
jgi:hypothetical protein